MTQQEALDILKMGVHVYLTGEAGTGKTNMKKWKNGLDILSWCTLVCTYGYEAHCFHFRGPKAHL